MSRSRRIGRLAAFGAAPVFAAAAIAVVTIAVASPDSHPANARPHVDSGPSGRPSTTAPTRPPHRGQVPPAIELASYTSCDGMLHDLRTHTAAHVTAWGIDGPSAIYSTRGEIPPGAVAAAGKAASASDASTSSTDHSGTNNQEPGVDEPDLVQTDGRRVVSVSGGVLRVVDAARHRITGIVDLSVYGGSDNAQLLLHGDRALVLLGGGSGNGYPGGGVAVDYLPTATGTTAILIDLHDPPSVIGTFHTAGAMIAARMVDGTVRLVVGSAPRFAFPTLPDNASDKQRRAANRTVVREAAIGAWLPSYSVTAGTTSTTHVVPCTAIRHPKSYTGTALLSVYTISVGGTLGDLAPVAVTADGVAAYATASSLYVASTSGRTTQLHRFDVSGSRKPVYLGSGSVPGALFDPYSMSQYGGALRVVTTTGQYTDRGATSVYVLDAATLSITGHVSGLGRGENLHAVRFIGPLAYVVTFKSVDPLYVLDLHDPAHPRKAGELTITGYSDYLHPTSGGRLVGVGQNVDGNERVTGLQVSLFDVANAAHPRRLARVVRNNTPSETPIDPHAFLWWPKTSTAVVPIDSWTAAESGAALVLHVDRSGLRVVGTIRNPAGASTIGNGDVGGIGRSFIIGADVWTMSAGGLAVSDLHSLHRQAWIVF